MYFVERFNQGESKVYWLKWLTEPPAVCQSVIMGDLSPGRKGVCSTCPEAFRTEPLSCPVQGISTNLAQTDSNTNIGNNDVMLYINLVSYNDNNQEWK